MFKLGYALIILIIVAAPFMASAQFELFENLLEAPRPTVTDDFPLDLVWEASTRVPPEYEGKALATNGSVVVVSALTPTKNTAGLTFLWRVEDSSGARRIEHASLAKNQFAFSAETVSSNYIHSVSVNVEETATGRAANGRVTIPVKSPEVTSKALSPSGALLEPSVNTLTLPAGSSLSLLARTFFFNVGPEELQYSWIFNGERLFGGGSPDRLDINVSSGSGGAAQKIFLEVFRNGMNERATNSINLEIIR